MEIAEAREVYTRLTESSEFSSSLQIPLDCADREELANSVLRAGADCELDHERGIFLAPSPWHAFFILWIAMQQARAREGAMFFRGQADVSLTHMTASIFRSGLTEQDRRKARAAVALLHHMLEQNEILHLKGDDLPMLARIIGQHYDIRTSLLDVTLDPAVAIYFALLNPKHANGAAFALDWQHCEQLVSRAVLVDADIRDASIYDCNVYGVSAWGLERSEKTFQRNLRVSQCEEAPLSVDDLEVAQFIYLMVRNPRIRDVIDTISNKGVLILGRFTAERKAVLDALRMRLRVEGYVPIVFDFEKPTKRDFEETVKVLAGLSRFVIVDITNPSSSPLELHGTVPEYMIPFVPIIMRGEKPFSMFEGLQQKFDWVLDTLVYPSQAALLRDLESEVIRPALAMEARIAERRKPRPQKVLEE